MKKREIAISDVHGCYKTFRALVEERVQLTKDDALYLLGDYIDRGPDSKAVIDYILKLKNNGYDLHCLRGNHEQMLLDAKKNVDNLRLFLRNGGKQTLENYNCTIVQLQEHPHYKFFQNLKYFIELEDYYLVHAGFNFRSENPFLDTKSMLWIRSWYSKIKHDLLKGKVIVHGHTPQTIRSIKAMCHNMRINKYMNIDAGCFYHKKMCALDLTNQKLYFQDCLDIVNFP